jgi:hypothetical protein
LVPTGTGWKIHRAKFPLSKGILDTSLESPLLLLVAYFKPKLAKSDTARRYVALHHWTKFEKPGMLLFRAKAHHMFHPGTVVPTAIEYDDLARCRKVPHVPLKVHLRLLSIGGSRKSDESEYSRAYALHYGLDCAAFTCPVTALKDYDDALASMLHPLL